MKQAQIEAIAHKDVRGNTLLYLKIVKDGKEVLINIGAKTFNAINDILQPTQTPIPTSSKEMLESLKRTEELSKTKGGK